jgi:hypothetical protein
MNKISCFLLLVPLSASSVYYQHKSNETFSGTAVNLFGIYPDNSDLLGVSDVNGLISLELINKRESP